MTTFIPNPNILAVAPGHQFEVVPSTREGALVFCMSPETGQFIIGALQTVRHPKPELVIRRGYGELTLPDESKPKVFSTARIAKGATIFRALDQVRIDFESTEKDKRILAAALQIKLTQIAGSLIDAQPHLATITGRDGTVQYDPANPSSLWKSSLIEDYLYGAPIIAPNMPGQIRPPVFLNAEAVPVEYPQR